MADKLILEFQAKTDDLDKRLKSIEQSVSGIAKSAKTASKETESAASSMGSAFTKAGALIAASFTLDAVISFGKEVVDLAAKAEGVERAFKRVGSPQLLQGLRDATRGTVTDLVLMQNAVKASNFDIPLENLASLFKFAQARARETGESVDYLVDSIILGIGRKSPLILDNLGISAVALREKFKGISTESASVGQIAEAVGEIATEAMAEMGDQADTTADKIAQITTALQNMKVEAGKQLISVANALFGDERAFDTQVKGTIEYATAIRNAGQIIRDDYERTLRVVEGRADREQVLAEEAKVRETQLANLRTQLSNKTSKEVIEDEKMREFLLTKAIENAVGLDIINRRSAKENLRIFNEDRKNRITQVGILQEQIRTIENLGKVQTEEIAVAKAQIKNVFYYTQAIKALKDELEKEGTTRERIKQILKEIPPLQEELARLLGQETEATKKAREEVEKLAKAEEDRWKALEAQADDRLKKHFEVEEFISDRTARGLREQMEMDLKAEVIKGANAEATAMSIGLAEDDIIAIRQASIDEQLRIEGEYRAKIQALEDEAVDATAEVEEKKRQLREQTAEDGIASFMQYAEAAQRGLSLISQAQANASAYELQVLENQFERGAITREQYDEKRKQIMREQANDAKNVAIFQGIINGIVATINAFRDGGPILAAITAALVAAEVAVIAATPVPAFAEGGYVDEKGLFVGRSHKQGGITIEAEGGEFITSKGMAKKYGHIVEAVNKGTIEKLIAETYVRPAVDAAMLNGFADMGKSAIIQDKFNDMNLLRAIDRHRDSEVQELRLMNMLLAKYVRQPKRGYA